jgi:hypothetical protein
LGRFIRGEDLRGYVKDFLESKFEGARLLASDEDELNCKLELSTGARVAFLDFLEERRLQGSTRLLSQSPLRLLFDNRHGRNPPGVERVTQDHSLVRFVAEELKRAGKGPLYSPISAIELTNHAIGDFERTTYAYTVVRWTVSGARDVERLEYLIQHLVTGSQMDGERAEFLINTAAMHGRDWLSASNVLDHHRTASVLDECRAELEERFRAFRDAQIRENQDRVNFMVSTLQHHLENQRRKFQERIQRYMQFGTEKQKKMIPAERGRLNKLAQRINAKIAELRLKESVQAYDSMVSCGVVRLV